jgi:iron(III) transport system substrate-binding protein
MNSNIIENKELYKTLKVIFPNQSNRGTHINISGAGITKYSKNYKNAVIFLEYMTSEFAQSLFSEGNNEYAVYGNGKGPIYLLGEFKKDKLDSYILGKNQAIAMKLFDKAGWK